MTLALMEAHGMKSKLLTCRNVRRMTVAVPRLLRSLELIPILPRHMLGRKKVVFDMFKTLLHLTQDRPIISRTNNGRDKILSSQHHIFTAMAPQTVRVQGVNTENQDGDNRMDLLASLVQDECKTEFLVS